MNVTGVTGGLQTGGASAAGLKAVPGLENQFMKILLTELRYQDPMDPMKDRDFFTQMAQFTTATQMEDLNASMAQLMAVMYSGQVNQNLLSVASLIGREFTADISGVTVTGVIEAVAVRDFRIMIKSGDREIAAENLTLVGGYHNATESD